VWGGENRRERVFKDTGPFPRKIIMKTIIIFQISLNITSEGE